VYEAAPNICTQCQQLTSECLKLTVERKTVQLLSARSFRSILLVQLLFVAHSFVSKKKLHYQPDWKRTVKFYSLLWTSGTVNFNDRLHAYRNNTWELVETSLVVPQRDLADAFRYTDVTFFEYQHRANPAYADSQTSPMDIIADLTASINEHSAKGSSQDTTIGASNIIVTAIEKTSTAFGNFRSFLLIIAVIIALIIGLAICIATNCCGISRLLQYLKGKFDQFKGSYYLDNDQNHSEYDPSPV